MQSGLRLDRLAEWFWRPWLVQDERWLQSDLSVPAAGHIGRVLHYGPYTLHSNDPAPAATSAWLRRSLLLVLGAVAQSVVVLEQFVPRGRYPLHLRGTEHAGKRQIDCRDPLPESNDNHFYHHAPAWLLAVLHIHHHLDYEHHHHTRLQWPVHLEVDRLHMADAEQYVSLRLHVPRPSKLSRARDVRAGADALRKDHDHHHVDDDHHQHHNHHHVDDDHQHDHNGLQSQRLLRLSLRRGHRRLGDQHDVLQPVSPMRVPERVPHPAAQLRHDQAVPLPDDDYPVPDHHSASELPWQQGLHLRMPALRRHRSRLQRQLDVSQVGPGPQYVRLALCL